MSSTTGACPFRTIDDCSKTARKLKAFADQVRADVDAKLAAFLEERATADFVRGLDARAVVPIRAASELATRGGKRLRAVLLAASYEACGGVGGAAEVAWAGVSLEVLQTYLLIHDDWMDGDTVRRGGPSVHTALETTLGDAPLAAAAAILGGDYLCALALEALLRVPVPDANRLRALSTLARLQEEVVLGQLCDVLAPDAEEKAIERGYDLKTGSYTARGPCRMGAALAGASADKLEELLAFAGPLGIAFQLRDDLLGTFGNPRETGKPAGNDLRRGKRTPIVADLVAAAARAKAEGEEPDFFSRVFGNENASDADVAEVVAYLRASGAETRVEQRIAALAGESRAALERSSLTARGKELLSAIATAMTARTA